MRPLQVTWPKEQTAVRRFRLIQVTMLALLVTAAGCDAILGIPGDLHPATTSTGSGTLVLHEGHLGTLPATAIQAGALRVSDQAIEGREKVCAGDLCVWGSLSTKGKEEP